MGLKHLIYASVIRNDISYVELLEILKKAQMKNAALDVSGIFLYCEKSFFQVLEGEESVINTLYHQTKIDTRHTHVTEIVYEAIKSRDFPNWTMGFAELKVNDLKDVIGLSDFFENTDFMGRLTPGRAKKLLEAFKNGKWHVSSEIPS